MPEARLATAADQPAVSALFVDAGWQEYPADEVWVLCESADVVGVMTLIDVAPSLVFIEAVIVTRDLRRQGMATEMLSKVLASRTSTWWLECREELVSLYEPCGFRVMDAVPDAVRAHVPERTDRIQQFMRRG